MYDLILEVALMLSFGAIVYVMALGVPKVGEIDVKPSRIRAWIASLPLHHLDEAIRQFKDKVLRRVKIIVMKIDNFISSHLNKDKNGTGLGGPQV